MSHDDAHDVLDEQLDALLSSQAHLDDDGFAARVVSALPPERRKLRFTVLSGATLTGLGVALALPATRETLATFQALVFEASPVPLVTLCALASLSVAALWAALTA